MLALLRKMVDKAFSWAESNKRYQVNSIHGEAEAFLVLSEGFSVSSTDIEENSHESSFEVEDRNMI